MAASADIASGQPTARDPLVDVLARVVVGLVVVVLAATAGVVLYLRDHGGAPRTAVERDIATAETAVAERPTETTSWTALAYAYAEAGRTGEALGAVRNGRAATGSVIFDLVEGDVLRMAGDHERAIRAYDVAVTSIDREFEASKAQLLKEKGIVSAESNLALARALYGRALAHIGLGRYDEAVADLEAARDISPDNATFLAKLGDAYAAQGRTDDARAAYEEALRFVPDDADAIAGLKRLGGRQ